MRKYIAKDHEKAAFINGELISVRINIGRVVEESYEVNEGFLRNHSEKEALTFIGYWHDAISTIRKINDRYPQKGERFHTKDGKLFEIHEVYYDFTNNGYTLIEFDLI